MIEGVLLYVEYADGYDCYVADTDMAEAVNRVIDGRSEHGSITLCKEDRFWEVAG